MWKHLEERQIIRTAAQLVNPDPYQCKSRIFYTKQNKQLCIISYYRTLYGKYVLYTFVVQRTWGELIFLFSKILSHILPVRKTIKMAAQNCWRHIYCTQSRFFVFILFLFLRRFYYFTNNIYFDLLLKSSSVFQS